MTNSILTVGSIAFDTIQTPRGKAESVLGGSVNYFSIAASFYSPVKVVGVVGKDFPKSHIDWLSARSIDVSGIQTVDGKTFQWVGQYDGNLNEAKTLSTFLNVFETFNPRLNETQSNCSYVFLANIDPTLQVSLLDQVKDPQLIACDTMNFWITGKPQELRKTLQRVDILSINEGEAYLLSEARSLVQAAERIQDMGPSIVIIKRGEYGSAIFCGGEMFLSPAYLVREVVDPTGAGDSFAGALMGYLAQKGASRMLAKENPSEFFKLLKSAVIEGTVMASFTVEDFSIHRLKHLTPDELKARSAQFVKMLTL